VPYGRSRLGERANPTNPAFRVEARLADVGGAGIEETETFPALSLMADGNDDLVRWVWR
jgi:hypothetical protein